MRHRFAFLLLSLAMASSAHSAITQLEIKSATPYGKFKPGEFLRIEGVASGELSPAEPIPGLDRAPRNARGLVEYKAPFVLIAPKEKAGGNGALLLDIPNRGRAISHFLYNSPREPYVPIGTFERGNGFLQDYGFTVAMLQWELGQGIALPEFAGPDGRKLQVEGAGIAAIRDFADFLRNASVDSTGSPNPMAGRFDRTLVVGYSQTARVMKTFLIEGFNQAQGRRVFDGMHINASASGLANIFATGGGKESGTFFTPRFTDTEFRGVTEEPLTYSDILTRVVARGQVPPRMLVTNMTTDYWSIRASLARTGGKGTADVREPQDVRQYDVAGASHGRATTSTCQMPPGRLDFFPVMRATLLNLDRWVRDGIDPPPSRLMPLEPLPNEASLLQAPKHLPNAIVQAPRRDPDGNALGGVRLPDIEAPLGTHGAQNLPLNDRPCNLNAAYIAFAKTRADRAPGDTRPALADRYASRDDYVERIRGAARKLVAERFMLQADAEEVERAARSAPLW
jgi:hypothetical protein